MVKADNRFELYEKVWLMSGRIPVTIIDEITDLNGEKYFTVACETEYFHQQQDNPTDGFHWWCTTVECSPVSLKKKIRRQADNDKSGD